MPNQSTINFEDYAKKIAEILNLEIKIIGPHADVFVASLSHRCCTVPVQLAFRYGKIEDNHVEGVGRSEEEAISFIGKVFSKASEAQACISVSRKSKNENTSDDVELYMWDEGKKGLNLRHTHNYAKGNDVYLPINHRQELIIE